MGRFNFGSWVGTKSNGHTVRNVGRKKHNRRMFSCFASALPLKSNMNVGAIDRTLGNEKAAGLNGRESRRLASTLKPATDMASDTLRSSTSGAKDMGALSRKIAEETEKLERYMKANSLAMPTFDVDGTDDFPGLPEEIQKSRLEIINATKELRDLVVGPRESVRWGVWKVSAWLPTTSLTISFSRIVAVSRHPCTSSDQQLRNW